ncbi:MAG: class I SAM-dependent methyltransferase [Planctomycetota bacterium]|jgi:ubiquinone/menaquinone biosynthesis C-methylase UbiE
MARFYDRVVSASEDAGLREWRRDLLASASGKGLELGAGTGLNLDHYGESVLSLSLSEPDPHMRARLESRARETLGSAAACSDLLAERISLPDEDLDFVTATLVICSVRDPKQSLREIFRVLRPGGTYYFLEHVAHSPPRSDRWQRLVEPIWKRVMGNCHLTRRTEDLIRAVGFEVEDLQREDMPNGMGLVRSTIRGRAKKPDPA